MDKPRLLILGASGHGKVAADCAHCTKLWAEIFFYDDRWPCIERCGPWPVLGAGEALLSDCKSDDDAFVAIGRADDRITWLEKMVSAGISITRIIHPQSTIATGVTIGEGTLVVAGAVINIDSHIGKGCIINTGATIDHDCVLSDGVHICPGAHIAGGVQVGNNSWIGIGSSVCQYLKIGCHVTVGAGGVVTGDVPDGLTVVGVPARPQKKNKA
jgi:sugar O-acyltransferase (sialic acid O-acetyltransferase NeuD family)